MKKNYYLLLLFSGIAILSRSQAVMVMEAEGSKQGKFKSEAEFGSKHSDKIELAGFLFEIASPRDAASGQATGKRTYQPVVAWKKNGESSPQFLQALITNELLKKVTIEYHKPDPVYKTNALAYTIVLENVTVSGFREFFGPLDTERLDVAAKGLLYDEIKFVFEKITVTEARGKTTATDFWRGSAN